MQLFFGPVLVDGTTSGLTSELGKMTKPSVQEEESEEGKLFYFEASKLSEIQFHLQIGRNNC